MTVMNTGPDTVYRFEVKATHPHNGATYTLEQWAPAPGHAITLARIAMFAQTRDLEWHGADYVIVSETFYIRADHHPRKRHSR